MTSKDLILQEMGEVPEPILAEVLDFLRFLKATRLQTPQTVTIVSSAGETKVALDSLKQELPEISWQSDLAKNPMEQVRQELILALRNSGYSSSESIVGLVRDVKREMLAEGESH
ncbi:hypothetical protein [Coleofasciculus sp. F4-SAH-05]|uniref:hypothetical protein n=1 Tax=Coleofasciculus TaxID=669368 RepID=UPI0032F4536F